MQRPRRGTSTSTGLRQVLDSPRMVDPVRTPPAGFDALPVDEQIDYVQSLWDRIAAQPDRMPVPEWHLRELRQRQRDYELHPDHVSTWEEVRERILRRGDSST